MNPKYLLNLSIEFSSCYLYDEILLQPYLVILVMHSLQQKHF